MDTMQCSVQKDWLAASMIVIHREPEFLFIFSPSIPQYQSQNMSGKLVDVGDCGRLRCMQGKADTNISCVCTWYTQ